MVEHPNPQLLVARAQQGDREAFEQLMGSHQQRLLRFVSSRVKLHIGPPIDIQEIVQDTFVRAFESVGRFQWQTEDSFFRWLCGIAKHVLMKTAEEFRKSERLEDALAVPGRDGSPSRGLRRDERLSRLQRSIDELPADYSQVIRLARIDGLKIKEIAERMNRSPDSVKHLLARALMKLRATFGDTESFHLPDQQLKFPEDDNAER